jgi:hypothetical protein
LLKQLLGKTKFSKGAAVADNGKISGMAIDHQIGFAFGPAKIKTAKDYEVLSNILASTQDEEYHHDSNTMDNTRLMRSDGYKAIIERIKKGDAAEGTYDSNPLSSAPKLVAEVAKKKKLSEESAVYYLQLLTLCNPTAANVKKWNDWTTATINKAAKELIAAKLVLQAKRSRASRTHFIPGGWEALKTPHLPLESWKMPLYGLGRNEANDQLTMPLERIVPLQPIPDLFAAAWKRVQSGDEPKYEEVK